MRVQDCIVSVRRRSVGGIVDLAFAFTRQFGLPLFSLTALFAVPATLLVWYFCHRFSDPLIPSVFIFGAFSALLSGAIVAGIGPQVFGVPMRVGSSLAGLGNRLGSFGFCMIIIRMAQTFFSFCFFWPVLLITPYVGHVAEIIYLEQAPVTGVASRLNHLAGNGGYMRNFGRCLFLILFWLLISLGLFVALDLLSAWLFNLPILFGRLSDSPDTTQAISILLSQDPLVITALQITIWLPFPMIRLAWFFCYLDQRIRNECWDVELQFRSEAERLEGRA